MQAPLHHDDFKQVAVLAEIDKEVQSWMKENA
jgi:hypothetical protein